MVIDIAFVLQMYGGVVARVVEDVVTSGDVWDDGETHE